MDEIRLHENLIESNVFGTCVTVYILRTSFEKFINNVYHGLYL